MTMPRAAAGARPRVEVITFGETMLRLAPLGSERLEQAATLEVRVGGSESNMAVALAGLGHSVAWWSRLPASPIGVRIESEVRRWGVNTSHVIWDAGSDARAGLYFVSFGAPPWHVEVTYDRAHSAASAISAADITRERATGAKLLHVSGITPALSPSCKDAVQAAVSTARAAGMAVSIDVNYRARLWSAADCRKALTPLLTKANLLICTRSDAQEVFGLSGRAEAVAVAMRERFCTEAAVITCGSDGAVAATGDETFSVCGYQLREIVDPVGAGDAFCAGLLHGWLEGSVQVGLAYGVAMAAMKHGAPGDMLIAPLTAIERVMAGGDGRIAR
ncbi:MAG: sugar kinase [Armatimonadetes bacterium]|nr:sugar kinase [Armatimonadota bacterium]MDE2206046.1 sugar kinase [Armatimonadota bacterium]